MTGVRDVPLVGPGSELQLTIDGRVVPHAEVVAAAPCAAAAVAAAAAGRKAAPRGPAADAAPPPGQISLADL